MYSYHHMYLPSHDTGLHLGTLFPQSENTKFIPPRLLLPPLLTILIETPIANHSQYRFWNRLRDLDVEICRCESSLKSMESEDNKSVASTLFLKILNRLAFRSRHHFERRGSLKICEICRLSSPSTHFNWGGVLPARK